MLLELIVACCLLGITVILHASGFVLLLRSLGGSPGWSEPGFVRVTWLLIVVAWALLALHLLEITLWGLFYWWAGCLPDLETSFYFSGVTYATLGYGEVVLSRDWRLLGPLEGLVGIIMCGLSVSFFFVIVSKVILARAENGRTPTQP
ncbi:MAG TPA: potassium channel family protein [Polyangiales bacterium]|nr:potassium channel family protein [Polyangiales bacterium]